jgi:hypothetical protein
MWPQSKERANCGSRESPQAYSNSNRIHHECGKEFRLLCHRVRVGRVQTKIACLDAQGTNPHGYGIGSPPLWTKNPRYHHAGDDADTKQQQAISKSRDDVPNEVRGNKPTDAFQ